MSTSVGRKGLLGLAVAVGIAAVLFFPRRHEQPAGELPPLRGKRAVMFPKPQRPEPASAQHESGERSEEAPDYAHAWVRLREDASFEALQRLNELHGATVRSEMKEARTYVVRYPMGSTYTQALSSLSESVQPYGIQLPEGWEKAPKFIGRVYFDDPGVLEEVSVDVVECCLRRDHNYAQALMSEDEFWRVTEAGLRVEVDRLGTTGIAHEVLGLPPPDRGVASRRSMAVGSLAESSTFLGGYRTVAQLYADLAQLAAAYPGITQLVDYGNSYAKQVGGVTTPGGDFLAGHDLLAMKITNKSTTGTKPVFFLIGNIHAREITMPELCMRYIEWLVSGYGSDADATWLVDHHEIWVIPTANPDGHWLVELGTRPPYSGSPFMWRKTARPGCNTWPPTSSSHAGVDGNRNFNFKWGVAGSSTSLCAQMYRGPAAASEPESARIQDLVRSRIADQRGSGDNDPAPETATGILLQIHSHGNLVMWPWAFKTSPPPNAASLATIGRKYASYNGYTAGQAAPTLYAASGTIDDWAYGELGIAAHIFEIGGSFMPSYSTIDSTQWPGNKGAFIYAAKIARTPYRLAQGPDARGIVTSRSGSTLSVSALVDDTHNGGQPIAAAEVYVNIPPWKAGASPVTLAATDGSFNTVSESVHGALNVGSLSTGTHMLFVRGRDSGGNWGPVSAAFFETGTLPNQSPAIDSAPWADPNPVTLPNSTTVHVVAGDPDSGPEPLRYTWSKVSGPGTVSFSPNGTTVSDQSTASFSAAGSYVLRVTVTDGAASVTGDLSVSVLAAVPPPPGGLEAHWKLDEGSGTSALDTTGNGHTGALVNAPAWVPGKSGHALAFNKNNSRVLASDFPYAPAGLFSVAFWVNQASNTGNSFQYVFSHGPVGAKNSVNVYFVEGSAGTLRTSLADSNDGTANTALDVSSVADGTWHHYALVVGPSGSTVYIDGVARNSSAQGGGAFDPSGSLFMGCRQDLDAARFYGGLLDDVRIYSNALSATEVQELQAVVPPPPPPGGMEAHWKLDEGSGTSTLDATGNGHTGALVNAPAWVPGKSGHALAFNKNNSRVVASDFPYAPSGLFSVAFWVNQTNNAGNSFQYVFSHGPVGAKNSVNVYFVEGSAGTLRTSLADANDGTANTALDVSGVADGTWHHYALVVSPSGSTVYIDGVARNSSTQGGGAFDPSGSLFMGCRQDLDAARFYGGLLDDVRIYSKALSATEVQELQAVVSPPPPGGLEGSWDLDESTGARADNSGSANTLSDHGGVGAVSGMQGAAANFSGSNFLSITHAAQNGLDLESSLTLAAWIKPASTSGNRTIMAKYDYGNNQRAYRLQVVGGKLEAILSPDGSNFTKVTGTTTLPANRWQHVALTFDAVGRSMTLYLNGTPEKTVPTSFAALHRSTAAFAIGANFNQGSAAQLFQGAIDEARVYSKALAQGEIQSLAAFEIVVDNKDTNTSRTGTWSVSSGANPYNGQSLFNNSGSTFRWTPELPASQTVQVYAWWTYSSNRSTSVPFRVQHASGTTTVTVNMKDQTLGGKWNLLGTFTFNAGSTGYVEVSSENGQACADAVRFVKE